MARLTKTFAFTVLLSPLSLPSKFKVGVLRPVQQPVLFSQWIQYLLEKSKKVVILNNKRV